MIFLPASSPANEVRVLEVNLALTQREGETPEPIDFGSPVKGLDYSLMVADITPEQWAKIQDGELPLPAGWRLDGNRIWGRKAKKQ